MEAGDRCCAECGFLSLRNVYTGELDEVDSEFRATGNPPNRPTPGGSSRRPIFDMSAPTYWRKPICFVRAAILRNELPPLPDSRIDWADTDVQKVIWKDRSQCPGFTKWQQGFTPKEHREMLDRDLLLKRDDEIRKAIWEREDHRDATVKLQHKEEMDTIRGQHWWQIAVLGVALIIATLIGAMIQAGWFSRPW